VFWKVSLAFVIFGLVQLQFLCDSPPIHWSFLWIDGGGISSVVYSILKEICDSEDEMRKGGEKCGEYV